MYVKEVNTEFFLLKLLILYPIKLLLYKTSFQNLLNYLKRKRALFSCNSVFILLFAGSKPTPQNSAKAKKLSGGWRKSPLIKVSLYNLFAIFTHTTSPIIVSNRSTKQSQSPNGP
ncbi:hypothetical protein D0U04_27485 [Bacillus clarus]|uniref:Uncharacterized protein n=1 Tax=Bacillus clarus TaxID=2338372 RepID=A0ABX9KN24_9BACI|nr:hypothetical protein D0U04_27485 [Bacillus clarus]